MSVKEKPKVFVIMPFLREFFALYEKMKEEFSNEFEFTNAGDLDNQQNILKDIIVGINEADVVIADLTGLNPNVFYELGLAHAMNKKVIIITQDISELPFDIKAYRVNQYSMMFFEIPKLFEKLKELLKGSVDESVEFGNPVSDYAPILFECRTKVIDRSESLDVKDNNVVVDDEEFGEDGYLDNYSDIIKYGDLMNNEILGISKDMDEMNNEVNKINLEIDFMSKQGLKTDVLWVRNALGRLSVPIDGFATKLNRHVKCVSEYWNIIENAFLSLIENKFTRQEENLKEFRECLTSLINLQQAVKVSDEQIKSLVTVLNENRGVEKNLNKSMKKLIGEFEIYFDLTTVISSSIDRIKSKSEILFNNELNN